MYLKENQRRFKPGTCGCVILKVSVFKHLSCVVSNLLSLLLLLQHNSRTIVLFSIVFLASVVQTQAVTLLNVTKPENLLKYRIYL